MEKLSLYKLQNYLHKLTNTFSRIDKETYANTFELLIYEVLKYNIYNILPPCKYIQELQVSPFVVRENSLLSRSDNDSFSVYVSLKSTDTKEALYYFEYIHSSLVNMLNNIGITDKNYILTVSITDNNKLLTLHFKVL